MMNFTLITALIICSISWISVSGSESETVEVQSGRNVTLTCNRPDNRSTAFWFRLVNRTNTRCISVKSRDAPATYCTGFENGNFNMNSTTSTVSLRIKQVNLSDSGLYFCGFSSDGPTFSVIYLNVNGSSEQHDNMDRKSEREECDGVTKLTSVILGALTVLLMMIISGLAVKNRKLKKDASDKQKPRQPENQGSDELNYAAVNFCQKGRRREVEPNVLYAATR